MLTRNSKCRRQYALGNSIIAESNMMELIVLSERFTKKQINYWSGRASPNSAVRKVWNETVVADQEEPVLILLCNPESLEWNRITASWSEGAGMKQ